MSLGPALPKEFSGAASVEVGDNFYIIGGNSNIDSSYLNEIHQLSCSSGVCSWTTLTQKLNLARSHLVAIPIDDDTFCATTSKTTTLSTTTTTTTTSASKSF